jgi:hypothetical protein
MVVRMTVRLNGIVAGVLEGADLRPAAGLYFTAPAALGSYRVTASAEDAGGCEDGADRPMTLVVR